MNVLYHLIDRIKSRLSGWKSCNLFLGDHLILLSFFVSFSFFKTPSDIISSQGYLYYHLVHFGRLSGFLKQTRLALNIIWRFVMWVIWSSIIVFVNFPGYDFSNQVVFFFFFLICVQLSNATNIVVQREREYISQL